MEGNGFTYLNSVAYNFKEILSVSKIGAVTYKKDIPIEQKIINLEDRLKLMNAKLNAIRITYANGEKQVDIDEDTDNLHELIKKELEAKSIMHICLSGMLVHLKNNSSQDSKFTLYVDKIREQIEYLKIFNLKLTQINEGYLNILDNTVKIQHDVINNQNQFYCNLQEQKQQRNDEDLHNVDTSSSYRESLDKINKRIDKINFMRVLTSRLLIYKNDNWKKSFEFAKIIEKNRIPISIKSILE